MIIEYHIYQWAQFFFSIEYIKINENGTNV